MWKYLTKHPKFKSRAQERESKMEMTGMRAIHNEIR